jgi:hypothetical protein
VLLQTSTIVCALSRVPLVASDSVGAKAPNNAISSASQTAKG